MFRILRGIHWATSDVAALVQCAFVGHDTVYCKADSFPSFTHILITFRY